MPNPANSQTPAQTLVIALPALIKSYNDPLGNYSAEFLLDVLAYLMRDRSTSVSENAVEEFLRFTSTFNASTAEQEAIHHITSTGVKFFGLKLRPIK